MRFAHARFAAFSMDKRTTKKEKHDTENPQKKTKTRQALKVSIR